MHKLPHALPAHYYVVPAAHAHTRCATRSMHKTIACGMQASMQEITCTYRPTALSRRNRYLATGLHLLHSELAHTWESSTQRLESYP